MVALTPKGETLWYVKYTAFYRRDQDGGVMDETKMFVLAASRQEAIDKASAFFVGRSLLRDLVHNYDAEPVSIEDLHPLWVGGNPLFAGEVKLTHPDDRLRYELVVQLRRTNYQEGEDRAQLIKLQEQGKEQGKEQKPRWSLLPRVMGPLIAVLEFGAKKYSPGGWREIVDWRNAYFDRACRHLYAWWTGEHYDAESGLPHLAHAVIDCMILLARSEGEEDKEK